jgi:hypothetical protein
VSTSPKEALSRYRATFAASRIDGYYFPGTAKRLGQTLEEHFEGAKKAAVEQMRRDIAETESIDFETFKRYKGGKL